MKKEMKNSINEIKSIVTKMPKSINEALDFNMDDEMGGMEPEMEQEPEIEMPQEEIPVAHEEKMGADAVIAEIKKMALKAMYDLVDTPEDPNYEALKKIFNMLDKAPSEKEQKEGMVKNA